MLSWQNVEAVLAKCGGCPGKMWRLSWQNVEAVLAKCEGCPGKMWRLSWQNVEAVLAKCGGWPVLILCLLVVPRFGNTYRHRDIDADICKCAASHISAADKVRLCQYIIGDRYFPNKCCG
jgi:predicted metal-binding protein